MTMSKLFKLICILSAILSVSSQSCGQGSQCRAGRCDNQDVCKFGCYGTKGGAKCDI